MNDEKKREIALFRYGIIHDFVAVSLSREEKRSLMEAKEQQKWIIPYSSKTSISKTTMWRWIKQYKDSGRSIESLFPHKRKDKGHKRAIDDETGAALLQLRKDLAHYPVTELLKEMKRRNLIPAGRMLTLSSAYRYLQQHGSSRSKALQIDRRRFEAEKANDIWQSDVMHGPHVLESGRMKKTYLIAFIDDHSRLIVHAQFYFSENTNTFMQAFRCALESRGIPKKLYVDNGSAFRSKHLEWVCASLGISLIHAKPYSPQGKGKIERFFRTVRSTVMHRDRKSDLMGLNDVFNIWLMDGYHERVHSSTGKTPWERYSKHLSQIISPPKDLYLHFRKKARRRVSKDRVIKLEGRCYEAPAQLIMEQVILLYLPEKQCEIELFHKEISYGFLKEVDLHINSLVGRDTKKEKSSKSETWESKELSQSKKANRPYIPLSKRLKFS